MMDVLTAIIESLFLDAYIILRTIPSVFLGIGAR
jgi:hypothetical protein